jgi:transcriptional regulator with PAS, ATPase and Fis domain
VTLSLGQRVDINNLVEKYKKKYVKAAMKAAGNNKTKAAKMIGLNSQQVITKWIEALGIEIE